MLFRGELALGEADLRSALWLIPTEKLLKFLETFVCRCIPVQRHIQRALWAPVQHGKPLSHTSCKCSRGPLLCHASSEHCRRRLLSSTVSRQHRRAPLSCTASDRSARVNYGDCRAPSLRGLRQRSWSALLSKEMLLQSGSGKRRQQRHICVQMVTKVVCPVMLYSHPCRHESQFQSLLLPSIFPTMWAALFLIIISPSLLMFLSSPIQYIICWLI